MPEQICPTTFDQKVYALSKIVHQVKLRNNHSEKYTPSRRKHLRLLDDIALLLVTESGSDVAAVSFEQLPTEVIFYYAKNRAATDNEKKYIEELVKLAQASDDIDRAKSIFNNVLGICRPKILSRLDKVARSIKKLAPESRSFREDANDDVHRYLQRQLGPWYINQTSAVAFVDKFLSYFSALGTEKEITLQDSAKLSQVIRIAQATGSYKPVNAIYPDEAVAKRIRLLGDYFGAVNRIIRNADSIVASSRTVRFLEITPPHPVKSRMPTDYILILNSYANERTMVTTSYDELKTVFPGTTTLTPEDSLKSQRVTFSVHAECTIGVFMASRGRPWEFVEIGCSKGSCWLCERYLEQDTRLKFHVSNVHGKLQPGWKMPGPPRGDAMVEAQVMEAINDQLEEVLLRAIGNRRTDSEPRSESDTSDEGNESPLPFEGTISWML